MSTSTRAPHIWYRNGTWWCTANMRTYPSLSDKAMAWCAQRNGPRPRPRCTYDECASFAWHDHIPKGAFRKALKP